MTISIFFTILTMSIPQLIHSTIPHTNANANVHSHPSALPPIILIPGFMASKLYIEGKIPKNLENVCGSGDVPHKKAWISLSDIIDAKKQKCLFDQLTLKNDGQKSEIKNKSLFVDALNNQKFGDTSTVKCLLLDGKDENGGDQCTESIKAKNDEANFGPLIKWLTEDSKLGYKEGKNIFAAPYDWRFETNSDYLKKYFDNLTKLIEGKTQKTGKRALLILHSMGNLVGNYYLTHIQKSKEWQEKHIAATINVSAPFGGTVEVLEEVISGNSGRYFSTLAKFVSNSTVLPFARSFGSIATMLPNHWAFTANQELVEIPFQKEGNENKESWIFSIQKKLFKQVKKTIEIKNGKERKGYVKIGADIDELFEKIGIPFFNHIYHATLPEPQKHIKMHCIYGTQLPTPLKYIYGQDISKPPLETINGLGDDTINEESLRVCKKWKAMAPVDEILELPGVTHAGILHNEHFYNFVEQIVLENV